MNTWLDLLHRARRPPSGRRPLRVYLLGLVLVTLLPAVVAGGLALWRTSESYRESSGHRLSDTAHTLAHAVEHDLSGKLALIQALTASSRNPRPGLGLQEWLDASGVLHEAEVVHDAALLPAETVLEARRSGTPTLSNLYADGVDGAPRLAIVAPERMRVGRADPARLTGVILPPAQLVQLAAQSGASPASMLVAVTDGNGRLVARSRDAGRFVGVRVPDWDKVAATGGVRGLFEAVTAEGQAVQFAFQRLAGTPGWVVVVGEPLDSFNAGWQRLMRQLLLGGAIALGLALFLATWLARQVLRPVAQLARHAEHAVSGGKPDPTPERPTLAILEFEALRGRLEAAHAALRQQAEDARRSADALAVSERRYRTLAQAGALVLWRSTVDGALIAATGWDALTGRREASALGSKWLKLVHPQDRDGVLARISTSHADRERDLDLEFRLRTSNRAWRWVRVRGVLVDEPGRKLGEWAGVLEDVDERRRAQAHVVHLAHHDPLTGLANRRCFRDRLTEAMEAAQDGKQAALLCVDLDRFKAVNDSLGHPIGDALLQAVAQRLQHVVREGDTVARLGGDEFAIAQTNMNSPQDAEVLGQRIVASIGTPFDIHGHTVEIGASVGIMPIDHAAEDVDRLLACADVALYDAKASGRSRCRVFSPSADRRLFARQELEQAFASAFAERRLEVRYEPIVNARFGGACGYEAKLHWDRPGGDPMSGQTLQRLAEDAGLAVPVADWMLELACGDASCWTPSVRVAVDVNLGQLRRSGFSQQVDRCLAAAGLAPDRLELEVPEVVLGLLDDGAIANLQRLKTSGVRVTVDHFASTQSALGCLGRFPFDKVKIEEAFVRQLGREKKGSAVVRALAALCDTLGVASAAAGVESAAQLAALDEDECVEVQGPLFGPPQRAEVLPRLPAMDSACEVRVS